MCMFTFANKHSQKALVKGVERFECGSCPECLQKKSRKWALRCSMEAKVSPGVMVTLTYDSYKYSDGTSIEENPPDPTLPLSIEHCQKFAKRLRKYFAKKGKKIKYIIAGERGKRTNRAHYHALLFNVTFDDLVKYKKSGRGNIIYKSKILEKIWKYGICTVDCVNLSAKVARYCTKYCAKDSGFDDSFMLFSRGIGEQKLLELFNGKNYWIDGREYAIPREIWQKYIEKKYHIPGYSRYVGLIKLENAEKTLFNQLMRIENKENKDEDLFNFSIYDNMRKIAWKKTLSRLENSPISYQRQAVRREIFMHYRDNDPLYRLYLSYWKKKSEVYNFSRPNELDRIFALPDKKYWSYKQKAIVCKGKQKLNRDFSPPRTEIQAFFRFPSKKVHVEKSFAPLTCHYRANDTIREEYREEIKELNRLRRVIMETRNVIECVSPFDLAY